MPVKFYAQDTFATTSTFPIEGIHPDTARYRAAVCGAESWPEPMPDTGKDGAQRIKLSELAQKGFVRRGDCLVLWRPNPDSNGEYAEPFVAVILAVYEEGPNKGKLMIKTADATEPDLVTGPKQIVNAMWDHNPRVLQAGPVPRPWYEILVVRRTGCWGTLHDIREDYYKDPTNVPPEGI